jgi:hypothetical protein
MKVTYFNQLTLTRFVLIDNVDQETADAVLAKFGNPKDKSYFLLGVTIEADDAKDPSPTLTLQQAMLAINSHCDSSPYWDTDEGQEVTRMLKAAGMKRSVTNRQAYIVEREAMGDVADSDTPEDTLAVQSCNDWGTGEGQFHGRM